MKRNTEIDLLKFLLSLCVLGVHGHLSGFSIQFVPAGHLAVDFFFMVSAFYTVHKVKSNENAINLLPKHFCSRLKRLYVPFFLSVVFATILYCVTVKPTFIQFRDYFVMFNVYEFLPLQIFGFPASAVTGVQWFVTTLIVADTLLFACAAKFKEKFTKVFAPLIAVFLYGIVYLNTFNLINPGIRIINNLFFSGMLRGIADMFMGCVVYEAVARYKDYKLRISGGIVINLLKYSLLTLMAFCMFNATYTYDFQFIILVIPFLILVFAFPLNFTRVTSYLAKISTTLFMVHKPTGDAINKLYPQLPENTRAILYFVISIVIAYIIHLLAELILKLKLGTKIRNLLLAKKVSE